MKKQRMLVLSWCVGLLVFVMGCALTTDGVPAPPEAGWTTSDAEGITCSEQNSKIKVGLAWSDKVNTLEQAWESYMRAAADAYTLACPNVQFEWVSLDAQNDLQRQASNIQALMDENVQVIVARPVDPSTVGSSIQAAQAMNMKFITFDRAADPAGIQPNAHIARMNDYEMAYEIGKALNARLDGQGIVGTCVELNGPSSDPVADARHLGWRDGSYRNDQPDQAPFTPLRPANSWEPNIFGIATEVAFAPNNPLAPNCIFVASDFRFAEVRMALEKLNRWKKPSEEGHVWIASMDLSPDALQAHNEGYIDVVQLDAAPMEAIQKILLLTTSG